LSVQKKIKNKRKKGENAIEMYKNENKNIIYKGKKQNKKVCKRRKTSSFVFNLFRHKKNMCFVNEEK